MLLGGEESTVNSFEEKSFGSELGWEDKPRGSFLNAGDRHEGPSNKMYWCQGCRRCVPWVFRR